MLERIISGLLISLLTAVMTGALLLLYESQRPSQGPLSKADEKVLNSTVNRLSLMVAGIVFLLILLLGVPKIEGYP
jgi:hypothetical protein